MMQILNITESMVKLLDQSTYNSSDQSWMVKNMNPGWGMDITIPPVFWFENDARCQLSFEIGKII